MAKKYPKEWKLRCDKCTLNGASCYYRHYPLCGLEEALKVNYPKVDGKVKPFSPCYEAGTGKPCYTKPDNLPEPKSRDGSPRANGTPAEVSAGKGGKPKSAAELKQQITKQEAMKPRCCAFMIKDGKCDKGKECKDSKFHKKTKVEFDAQTERWSKQLADLKNELKTAK